MGFLALAALLLPQSGPSEQAFVELAPQPGAVYVEQPIRLTIRFGVEREYLRQNLLQLFTRPLDVPLQLELFSEAALPGTLPLELDADSSGLSALAPHPTFALGEEIVRAARSKEETRAGRTWVVLEFERFPGNYVGIHSNQVRDHLKQLTARPVRVMFEATDDFGCMRGFHAVDVGGLRAWRSADGYAGATGNPESPWGKDPWWCP